MNEKKIKEMVRLKYSEIALQNKETNLSSCCGSGGCSTQVYTIMSEEYNDLTGYVPDADLGLGCGLPTQFARIKKGDTVIDLGVASAILKDDYIGYIREAGFQHITILKNKPIIVPDDIMRKYLKEDELTRYKANPIPIHSITVYATKPAGCGCSSDSCC